MSSSMMKKMYYRKWYINRPVSVIKENSINLIGMLSLFELPAYCFYCSMLSCISLSTNILGILSLYLFQWIGLPWSVKLGGVNMLFVWQCCSLVSWQSFVLHFHWPHCLRFSTTSLKSVWMPASLSHSWDGPLQSEQPPLVRIVFDL